MKKTAFIVFILSLLFVSCTTKTVLIENARNTKDSVENIQLKSELNAAKKSALELTNQLELLKKEIIKISEQQNLSESEKQQLNEKLITVVEEYDIHGNMAKRTYSEKVSKLAKDLNRSEQKNKFLENELSKTYLLNEKLSSKLNSVIDEKTNLDKKVKFLEKVTSELKFKQKTKAKYPLFLLPIGIVIGILLSVFFPSISTTLRKIVK